MTQEFLIRLFEHNNWANAQIIEACAALSDAQLNAQPTSATMGSIRETLRHLVASQLGYLSRLTGVDYRASWEAPPSFPELLEGARVGGEGLLALARGEPGTPLQTRIEARDGYLVEPWVIMA